MSIELRKREAVKYRALLKTGDLEGLSRLAMVGLVTRKDIDNGFKIMSGNKWVMHVESRKRERNVKCTERNRDDIYFMLENRTCETEDEREVYGDCMEFDDWVCSRDDMIRCEFYKAGERECSDEDCDDEV